MARLPSFADLSQEYPGYVKFPDPQEVKDLIGGGVNAAWITNTCAIRMSRALNYNGIPVPTGFMGLHTVPGGDRKRYGFRVREMRKWLVAALGKPDFELRKPAETPFDRSTIAGLQGLIAFDIAFSDATGHLDLWDGQEITSENHMSRDYYDAATKISVWKAA